MFGCKRTLVLLGLVGVLACLTGCVTNTNRMPLMGSIPLEELKTQATYDVIGNAIGTSSGGKLFGIIWVDKENKIGQLSGSLLVNPVDSAAVYNAIESVPTADALIAPRWSRKVSNYIFYVKETVTVKGKAIRYNVSSK
jgi:hypothetical protein